MSIIFSSGCGCASDHGTKDPYGANTPSPISNPTLGSNITPVVDTSRNRLPKNLSLIPLNNSGVERVIRAFLSAKEPQLQRVLVRTWNSSRRDLKYDQIERALRDGSLDANQLQALQDAYVELINEKLAPAWMSAMESSSAYMRDSVETSLGKRIRFDERAATLRAWITSRGSELAVNLSNQQHRALQSMIKYVVNDSPMGARAAGRYIRATVGLTDNQAKAVQRHRTSLVDGGMSPTDADKQSLNYASRLHRIRAERIARTEMSLAFNQGALEQMRQAKRGALSSATIIKMWYTSVDERVCPHCGPLHEAVIGLEETFPGATKRIPNTFTAPAHPGCRCAIIYNLLE